MAKETIDAILDMIIKFMHIIFLLFIVAGISVVLDNSNDSLEIFNRAILFVKFGLPALIIIAGLLIYKRSKINKEKING